MNRRRASLSCDTRLRGTHADPCGHPPTEATAAILGASGLRCARASPISHPEDAGAAEAISSSFAPGRAARAPRVPYRTR